MCKEHDDKSTQIGLGKHSSFPEDKIIEHKKKMYVLHKEVYKVRPMKISYYHPNIIIKWIETKRIKIICNLIKKHAKEHASILDIGCEECFLFDLLGEQDRYKQIGVDFLKDPLVKVGNRYPTIQADAHELPFKDKTFDIAICSETLEHVSDPKEVLKEIHRITKNMIIISVPNDKTVQKLKKIFSSIGKSFLKGLEKGKVPEHINNWDRKSIGKFLEPHFNIKKIMSLPSKLLEIKLIVVCKPKERLNNL